MPFAKHRSGLSLLMSAVLAVAFTGGAAVAGEDGLRPPAAVPAKPAPAKKSARRSVGLKTTELPPSALGIDQSSHGYEPGDQTPDLKLPDQFRFGDNTLHIDADKKDPTPPVGFESNGQAVLNKAPSEPVLKPSYLGLRLTAPITTPGR
ncbi:MAG TPA: hypothetical protein VFB31_17080 [Pseudolabrys sp.]|nr:hypothetical protein [Pseudolabrys sp.]